jgi:hypothetical protein
LAEIDKIASSFLQTGRGFVRTVGLVRVVDKRAANVDDELALLGYHDVVIVLGQREYAEIVEGAVLSSSCAGGLVVRGAGGGCVPFYIYMAGIHVGSYLRLAFAGAVAAEELDGRSHGFIFVS